jgi:hypothetical protein
MDWVSAARALLALLEATIEDNHAYFQRPRDLEERRLQLDTRQKATDQAIGHIQNFLADYGNVLTGTIRAFLEQRLNELRTQVGTGAIECRLATKQQLIRWVRSEFQYHLDSNQEERIRSRADRAFDHLNRLLVVDDALRDRWSRAFAQRRGEEACEKLGSAHLLWHGIFSFKAGAKGAATDQIFGEPINVHEAERVADGLVLTEWKKCETRDGSAQFEQARRQLTAYGSGLLSGIWLGAARQSR